MYLLIRVLMVGTFMVWTTSNLWATCGWTISCGRMSARLLDFDSWYWYATFAVSGSGTMQYKAKSRVPRCPKDPVWTNSSHGTPPLSCTVLDKCLLVCLHSQMCTCSSYTAIALTDFSCTSLIYCDMHTRAFMSGLCYCGSLVQEGQALRTPGGWGTQNFYTLSP
jgi:hypothetical protein